ncbi:YqhR family membrane protein [Neobacillus sp. SM06]|uniref:YqhR family membrane protein n=1 Tax=Neobacillus sp. SM06 TaxID=3422492 RepID=UPI003D2916F1
MGNQQTEKKRDYPKPMSFIVLVFWTGLFGGIFWSLMGYIAYLFSFTELSPRVVLEPWALGNWKEGWLGTIISLLVIGIFSVAAAYLYYAFLKKRKGIWPGIGYGLFIFLLIFFVLNPLFPSIRPITDLSRDTIITSICLYAIYGMFIGYSISYEYENKHGKNQEAAD